MKTALIICFSCLCVGCSTFNSGEEWPSPVKPTVRTVEIVPVYEADIKDDGFYMDRTDAMHLADNVDELKAYVKKLEVQVEKMKKYYGAK